MMMKTRFLPLISILAACGGGGDPPVVNDSLRVEFVRDFSDDIVIPALTAFRDSSETLATATLAYAEDPAEVHREAARHFWRAAMADWQHVEMLLVGPAGLSTDVAGGQDLRDEIYSWPLTNACRIDQETVTDAHASAEGLLAERVNVRGLDAIEYLLFDSDEENDCSAVSALNAEGTWAEFEDSITSRRARYAASAAQLVHDAAGTLLEAWTGGFRDAIVNTPSDVYDSNQDALNAISDAIFYLDKELKDMKLAGIGGVADIVGADTREHRYATHSLQSIQRNLAMFSLVFRGVEGSVGLEELLQAEGANSLVMRMREAIVAAETELESLGQDVAALLEADPMALFPLYERIKTIADLLKTEVVTVLDLELPDRTEGDND